jgi:hypothetical protein
MLRMDNGKKIAIGVTAVMVVAVFARVGLIYRANHDDTPSKPAYSEPPISDDDAVTYTLRQERPDSIKDERTLIGKTIWIRAGGQMNYYHYAAHHADYAHPVGTLLGAEPLLIKDVFEQVPPKIPSAVTRISAGQRHVLLAFTMPKSADPNAEYAVPVGHYIDGSYEFLSDTIFFYDDPHMLYKHWSADAWTHVDKHEVVPGMSEAQAMLALGQIIEPSSDTPGDRTVTYNNNDHPIKVVFEHNKAISVTPEK